ncbi:MAG: universal stress protein [Williamsia sp.]|nr:universal stress protein [Williamsia sp.]
MKAVLVPTDLSAVSQNAGDYAAALCRETGAELILLHVYMLPTPISELSMVLETADEIHHSNEKAVQREAERISLQSGVAAKWLLRMGIASDEIGYLEKERGIDLVVMGMRQEEGFNKLLGSTTTATIRKCQRAAVLVIPQHVQFVPFKSVAYATDLSYKMNPDCFQPLISLIHRFKADLHLVHVDKGENGLTTEQVTGKMKLEAVLSNVYYHYHSIHASNVENGLNEFIKSHSPEMLAMVVHKHNLLERLFGVHHTQTMVYHTSIPLLVLLDKS